MCYPCVDVSRRDDTLVVPTLFLCCNDGAIGVSLHLFDAGYRVSTVKGETERLGLGAFIKGVRDFKVVNDIKETLWRDAR